MSFNLINKNKKHGIYLMKNSKMMLTENIIIKNISNGIYSRDKSQIHFHQNYIWDNKIDSLIENKKGIIGEFEQPHEIGFNSRYYTPKSCSIF